MVIRTRFAIKKNHSVIGGFTKLLSAFRKEYNGTIISYADRRYSEGDVYHKNGFILTRTNSPSYYVVKKGTEDRQHRRNFQKKKIAQENDNRTEQQILFDNGYYIIYDCGTLTFVLE